MKTTIITALLILLPCMFGFGVWYGQDTFEPKIIETVIVKQVPIVVEKEIKTLIVKVPDIFYDSTNPEDITTDRALDFLRTARHSHQVLIDREKPIPQLVEADGKQVAWISLGGIETQRLMVKRYDQIIDLIIKMSERENGT